MGYDTATTTETQLWIDNNEPLQRRKMFMWANLARKLRRGIFNPKLAEKLFRYLCDDAARSYRKEIGEPLPMDDRRQAEKDLVQEFLSRVKDAERTPGDLPADVLAELRKPSTAKPGAVGMRSPLRPSPPTSSTPAFYVESNDAPDAAWRRESFLDFDTARRYALENARKHPAESSVQFLVNDRNTGRTLLVFGGGGQVVASELVSGRKHAAPEATEPVVARRTGADPHYQIELANKIAGGRAVGNSYIVTRRPDRLTCELARFDTREEAEAWIAERTPR